MKDFQGIFTNRHLYLFDFFSYLILSLCVEPLQSHLQLFYTISDVLDLFSGIQWLKMFFWVQVLTHLILNIKKKIKHVFKNKGSDNLVVIWNVTTASPSIVIDRYVLMMLSRFS